jgi:hypothetical protein
MPELPRLPAWNENEIERNEIGENEVSDFESRMTPMNWEFFHRAL